MNTVMNIMFHKMLGISLVIERLFVSQEGSQLHGANYSVQIAVRGGAIAHAAEHLNICNHRTVASACSIILFFQ